MSLFGKVSKNINKALNGAGRVTTKAVNRVATAPANLLAKQVQAFGKVAGSATQVLRDNPELAGLAGNALGVSGLGDAFAPKAEAAPAYQPSAPAAAPGVPLWVWIAGGAAALLGLVLFLRK